jgi:glycerol-3-phosphate dehydrogenase (NAD(P)+)
MTSGRASVLILGHGEIGSALEHLLAPRHAVSAWEKNLADGSEAVRLEAAAAGRQFILFAVPAAPHAELAARVAQSAPRDCICLSVAKGLDGEGRTPAAVLARALGDGRRFGVLYGPMIAEELRANRPGFADLGARYHATFERVEELFAGTALRLRHSADVAGVSWCAVLKNVYVPLLGAAEGLGLGDNMRGCLAAAAVDEMDRIVQAMGGRPGTAYGLAGLGDLITTATSAGSHHRRIGIELAQGKPPASLAGEGLHTIAMVRKFGLLEIDRFPLLALAAAVIDDPRGIAARIEGFLQTSFADARPAAARQRD